MCSDHSHSGPSCSFLVVSDSVTPWTAANPAPLSMGFFTQEYWSGLPFLPPGDVPGPGMKPVSPGSLALAGSFYLPLSQLGNPLWSLGIHKIIC